MPGFDGTGPNGKGPKCIACPFFRNCDNWERICHHRKACWLECGKLTKEKRIEMLSKEIKSMQKNLEDAQNYMKATIEEKD